MTIIIIMTIINLCLKHLGKPEYLFAIFLLFFSYIPDFNLT